MPSSIMINYNDENFRIFMTSEDLKCFTCNQYGHIQAQFPYQLPENQNKNETLKNTDTIASQTCGDVKRRIRKSVTTVGNCYKPGGKINRK